MVRKKELIPLHDALSQMLDLFEKWKLAPYDWVMVDEFAYQLLGYDVRGNEVKTGHLDIYVNPGACPWPDKHERSVIPPVSDGFFDQWGNFMSQTGYGLDLLRAKPEFLNLPRVEYRLDNGRMVQVMKAAEMTRLFVEQTIMHYSLQEVSTEKMTEWIAKLSIIGEAAKKKEDVPLKQFCKVALEQSKRRWSQLIESESSY